MLVLAAVLSAAIGLVLGLLGGGGSILMLPLLVHVVRLEARPAIASSLLVVGVTSLIGAAAHARAGRVRYGIGVVFGAGAMAGAYLGGRLARWVPDQVLLALFAVLMLVTAAAMLRRPAAPVRSPRGPSVAGSLGLGACVGVVAGLVGAGGGFLIVPALVLVGGLEMPEAVGTSLLVIALQSGAGLAGQLAHTQIELPLLAVLGSCAVLGTLVGTWLSRRLRPVALRRAFAWLVLAVGVLFLGDVLRRVLSGLGGHPR
ncbi:MAG: sulfite exporter TauE/SafE family protein [Myxococcales bacterium]|nr:sulfite exporter TauE/SafE family protein [Myxococcota bacterium]MDW8282982.1 sulfite exporter TauE/SafE family protein [Myxococcales bacterium]